ncbi:peroxiredoxin [Lentzea sp. NPDC060358]|uniref:peroxiredoxin n=1 Tax=Lentzea sp. NPDC060358 TaxID=3347103 RepID=UPI003648BFF6
MEPGDLAPDFTLPDQDGTDRKLSELLENGPVVLFFYPGAMSRGCTAESCHFRDLAAEFAAAGAQRVGISLDDVATQKQFAEQHSFDYPLLSDADGEVAEQFGVRRRFGPIPLKRHTFVIGEDRTVLKVIRSEFSMNAHADKALAVLRSR